MQITTTAALRALYPEPRERALKKQLDAIDGHARRLIELAPFVVLASAGPGGVDASPRGGAPGFVRVVDAQTLWIPDSPGNNRLDSLRNIVERGDVGLLFMIPGIDETLRINGRATLTTDADVLARCADARRTPKLVIAVAVREVYLHCAKAFMRSKLWAGESRLPRGTLPTMGQMLNDQTGIVTPAETAQEMARRYEPDL